MKVIGDIDRDELQAAFEEATDPKAIKRLLVALAYTDGVSVDTLSARYGISRSTIYAWLNRFDVGSIAEAITDDSRPGRPPALDDTDRDQLSEVIADPPTQYGFHAEAWTPRLLRKYIDRTYNVEYSIGHARRLLREYRRDE